MTKDDWLAEIASLTLGKRMPRTKVDFPAPDTPQQTVRRALGIANDVLLIFRKRAFCRCIQLESFGFLTPLGRSSFLKISLEAGYADGSSSIAWLVWPYATIFPPLEPASGPMSIIKSACSIVSMSCSTTKSEFPRFRSFRRASINLWLSTGCKPMDGSSKTYKTPDKFDPNWLASRILCASPPDNEDVSRSSVRYSSPTFFIKLRRSVISGIMLWRIGFSVILIFSEDRKLVIFEGGKDNSSGSENFLCSSDSKITFRAMGPNLCPLHFGQILPFSIFHQSPLAGKSSFIHS